MSTFLTTTQICSIVVSIIILCIYLPLSLYGPYMFFKRRHHVIVKKRYSQITFIICFLLILVTICEGCRAPVKSFNYKWEWWFFHPIVSLLSTVACWLTLKLYLNYFDVHYANAILSSEWKIIINPETMQTNWFILNKNRYGNIKRWYFLLIIVSIFNIFGAYIWEFIYANSQSKKRMYANMVSVLISLICIILMTLIRYKTPIFHDVFYQREEIIRIIRPSSVAILYIIISLTIPFPTTQSHNINQLFVFLTFATLSVWIIYTSTINVVSNNEYWFDLTAEEKTELDIYHVAKSSMALNTSFDCSSNDNNNNTEKQTHTQTQTRLSMETVMRNEKGFEALIFHSAMEFSSEIFLFLIEITQHQQMINEYYISNFENITNNETLPNDNWLTMPPKIPKSQIVFRDLIEITAKDDKPTEFMKRALRLYVKYIKIDGQLEINISGVCRKTLTDIFETINGSDNIETWLTLNGNNETEKDKIKRIYAIFEPCMDELHGVLNTLFTRFTQTELFAKLCTGHVQFS